LGIAMLLHLRELSGSIDDPRRDPGLVVDHYSVQ
jgi:hypothetical protein